MSSLPLSAEANGYLEAHDIRPLMERMLREVVVHKPQDPISFLIDLLQHPECPRIILSSSHLASPVTKAVIDFIVSSTRVFPVSLDQIGKKNASDDLALMESTSNYIKTNKDCAKSGWLLIGLPKNRTQALKLQALGVLPTHVINLDVAGEQSVETPEDNENRKQMIACYKPESVRNVKTDQSTTSNSSAAVFEEIATFVQKPVKPLRTQGLGVMISGAPASGKGTQCERIVSEFQLIHISTGDLLRDNVKRGTELGAKAKAFMEAGKLVPDQIIIDLVLDRLAQTDCRNQGWLLDGFPRTRKQALALSAVGVLPDRFVQLDVPDFLLVERVTGRRTDPATGKIYHMKFSPPDSKEVAARLVQRADDNEETVRTRLQEYHKNAKEVLEEYAGLVKRFDGTGAPDDVFLQIKAYIQTAK
eukprot:ANDGO_07163.mRNA.1 Adenylate kinase